MHMELTQRIGQVDRSIIRFLQKTAIPTLRITLGIVYIWFGALKVFGVSPVTDLLAKTLHPLPEKLVVPCIGVWEMAVGIGLLFRIALRVTLALFFLQLAGTFSTMLRRPQDTFQDNNPLLLTKDGEFVLKNLVLLAAGIAVGSRVHRESEEIRG
jgi:uncharacterized membrane protein YkgB